MGIRKEIAEEGKEINTEVKGVVEGRVKIGKEKWRVVVHAEKRIGRTLENIEQWVQGKEMRLKKIIGGTLTQGQGGKAV